MSCRIAIYLAVAAIGISCIATEASAGKGGGARGMGGSAGATKSGAGNKPLANQPSGSGTTIPRTITPDPGGDRTGGGAGGRTGGGAYAPASYNSNTACGRYPYPPCNRVLTR
jgi:hypothetical protein